MFSSIIHMDYDGTTEIYHGYLLDRKDDYFVFGFRVNRRNYVWECRYDYWDLRI
jgi:hypothetical protein